MRITTDMDCTHTGSSWTDFNHGLVVPLQGCHALIKIYFLTFPACFYIPIIFSNTNSNLLDMRNSRNKLKKRSATKNCSGISLFEQIVVVISKFLQILGLQPQISRSLEHFFLTVGQNNFGNKIPL